MRGGDRVDHRRRKLEQLLAGECHGVEFQSREHVGKRDAIGDSTHDGEGAAFPFDPENPAGISLRHACEMRGASTDRLFACERAERRRELETFDATELRVVDHAAHAETVLSDGRVRVTVGGIHD